MVEISKEQLDRIIFNLKMWDVCSATQLIKELEQLKLNNNVRTKSK